MKILTVTLSPICPEEERKTFRYHQKKGTVLYNWPVATDKRNKKSSCQHIQEGITGDFTSYKRHWEVVLKDGRDLKIYDVNFAKNGNYNTVIMSSFILSPMGIQNIVLAVQMRKIRDSTVLRCIVSSG